MPATCGVAMDVPENRAPSVPEPIRVDWTATPGATMSGFSALFRSCGPADEKLANALKPGFAIVVAAKVPVDRKSTRLNSSHSQISYAVFCLKKKNNQSR